MYDMGVLVWQATAPGGVLGKYVSSTQAPKHPTPQPQSGNQHYTLCKLPRSRARPVFFETEPNSLQKSARWLCFALKLNDLIAFKLNKIRVRKVLHFTHSLALTDRLPNQITQLKHDSQRGEHFHSPLPAGRHFKKNFYYFFLYPLRGYYRGYTKWEKPFLCQ